MPKSNPAAKPGNFDALARRPQPPSPPLFTVQEARQFIDDLDRTPFKDFLSVLLGCHPTPEAIKQFANSQPDRWGQAVNLFSKLAGYTEEISVTHNIFAAVKVMSDMDLEREIGSLKQDIGDSYLIDPDVDLPAKPLPPTKPLHKSRANASVELPNGLKVRTTPVRQPLQARRKPNKLANPSRFQIQEEP